MGAWRRLILATSGGIVAVDAHVQPWKALVCAGPIARFRDPGKHTELLS
jgi:hypothetical protein